MHLTLLVSRLKAFAYDYLWIAAYLAGLVTIVILLRQITTFAPQNATSGQLVGLLTLTIPFTLIFAWKESSPQQGTWGKCKMELRVVDLTGARLSLSRALWRTVLKFIPWELAHFCVWQYAYAGSSTSAFVDLLLILVWVLLALNAAALLLSKKGQTLYDWGSKTQVISI